MPRGTLVEGKQAQSQWQLFCLKTGNKATPPQLLTCPSLCELPTLTERSLRKYVLSSAQRGRCSYTCLSGALGNSFQAEMLPFPPVL